MNQIKRIITASILIPSTLILLFYANQIYFAVISAIIFSLILKEWIYIANIYYKGFIWVIWAIVLVLSHWILQTNNTTYLYFICGFWLFLFVLVYVYPSINLCKNSLFRAVCVMVIVYGSWLCLNQLFIYYSKYHILLMLLLVWTSDTGGYYFGRTFGELKLAPYVSPNKTIAGFQGSLILGIICGLVIHFAGFKDIISNYLLAFGISFIIVVASVMGDLVESMFKRELGVKESGRLLPGHGGIVDRTDSLISAIPFYLLTIHLINIS